MSDKHEWDEDAVDERLRAMAADYHRPEGTVPREAMWAAIAPSLRDSSAPAVLPLRRTHAARWRWAGALAAGLLIGVALDRGVASHFAVSRADHTTTRVATRADTPRAPSVSVTPSIEPTRDIASATERASTGASTTPRVALDTPHSTSAQAPSPRMADASRVRPRDHARSGEAPAPSLYTLAARQTLTQAEALLTSYRRAEALPRDQEAMRQAARWARDVLTSTRLLLDSPAARDPQLRALFTDLELVLAQIVQLSGAPLDAGERELIERAMRDRDLLPRIRSAVPAGLTAS